MQLKRLSSVYIGNTLAAIQVGYVVIRRWIGGFPLGTPVLIVPYQNCANDNPVVKSVVAQGYACFTFSDCSYSASIALVLVLKKVTKYITAI